MTFCHLVRLFGGCPYLESPGSIVKTTLLWVAAGRIVPFHSPAISKGLMSKLVSVTLESCQFRIRSYSLSILRTLALSCRSLHSVPCFLLSGLSSQLFFQRVGRSFFFPKVCLFYQKLGNFSKIYCSIKSSSIS